MFKKHVTEVNSSPLSGKDVKTLKKDLQATYRLSDDQLKKLFPSKADLVVQKLSNKAKTFACTGENPLFFDPDGRGNVLLPTVYALWQCPELLPKIFTYSEVSPKVCLHFSSKLLEGTSVVFGRCDMVMHIVLHCASCQCGIQLFECAMQGRCPICMQASCCSCMPYGRLVFPACFQSWQADCINSH